MRQNLTNLERALKISFKDKNLLENAFVHRSYLNEHKDSPLPSNEKLEFFGDSVLSLITSVYLYKNYPELKEGDYTEIKSSLVRTESLAQAAGDLNLGVYLYLSRGEELGGGRTNKNILADCFEALIACIFLDQSFTKAYQFVVNHLFKKTLDKTIEKKLYYSSKSKLQERIQGLHKTIPVYKVLEEKGPEHKRVFTIGVFLKTKKLAEAEGSSKKEAEEAAAQKALAKLK